MSRWIAGVSRSGSVFGAGLGLVLTTLWAGPALAVTYEVGPGQTYENLGDVPLETLAAGDEVLIHWRQAPYQEKFVVAARGEPNNPVVIRGVPGPGGELPVISGENATTRSELRYTNESRGVIKIGSADHVSDELVPSYIVIENLDVTSGRPPYTFDGSETYAENAAAIYVEKAEHLTIRGCVMRDSGNGLFIGAFDGQTQHVLIEGNAIYDNGIDDSIYHHNSYCAAIGIVYQYNFYGPLRSGCLGNNLKDRSAGMVARYNWIESGNRQLDLVDAEDSDVLVQHPSYPRTFVYGNVLIEPEDAGNRQIVHYGGDSGDESIYRKGTLYFYNNTVISTRSGNTTLLRLSTNEEHADVRNNIVYVTADANALALVAHRGVLDLSHNWLKPGWTDSHDGLEGTFNDDGTSVTGATPGFVDEAGQDFRLDSASACVNAGTDLSADVIPDHLVAGQYVKLAAGEPRPLDPPIDIGAYELCTTGACSSVDPDAGVPGDGGISLPEGGGGTGGASGSDGGTAGSGGAAGGAPVGVVPSEDEGGCGCRAPRSSPSSPTWLLFALLPGPEGSVSD